MLTERAWINKQTPPAIDATYLSEIDDIVRNLQGLDGISVTITDDDFIEFPTPNYGGVAIITGEDSPSFPQSTLSSQFYYDSGGSASLFKLVDGYGGNIDTLTNTNLTGTTGIDGKVTININNGSKKIQIENRDGGTITFRIVFL